MRRKTLVNNLKNVYSKERVLSALNVLGLPETVRGEALSSEQFVKMAEFLSQNDKNS